MYRNTIKNVFEWRSFVTQFLKIFYFNYLLIINFSITDTVGWTFFFQKRIAYITI